MAIRKGLLQRLRDTQIENVDLRAQVAHLEAKNAEMAAALERAATNYHGTHGYWELLKSCKRPRCIEAVAALSGEAKVCTCTAPPMQPCGPACKYPYTDEVATTKGEAPQQ